MLTWHCRSGLPKKTQTYIFFAIKDSSKFRSDLKRFIPLVTTVEQVLKIRDEIDEHKRKKLPGLVPCVGVNVSFSHFGLSKLGVDDSTLAPKGAEDVFTLGQKVDAVTNLGDPKNSDGLPDWEEPFLKDIDGVFIIAGDSHLSTEKKKIEVELIFKAHTPLASLEIIETLVGDVRPGDQDGHEQ